MLLLLLDKLNSLDTSTMQCFTGRHGPCTALFFLPQIFNDKMYWNNRPVSPLNPPTQWRELMWFRSPGFQTANKTAVTCAPLGGCNAFQAHRKEPVSAEWGGMAATVWSPSDSTSAKAQSLKFPIRGIYQWFCWLDPETSLHTMYAFYCSNPLGWKVHTEVSH